MSTPFEFDQKAAVEAILYLAEKSQDSTFHRISKLLYFADRRHLAQYGRFICGDSYIAMKHGPVPSGVYDMLKAERHGSGYLYFPEAERAFEVHSKHYVRPLRAPDLEWLSDSDIECLDDALERYDPCTFGELTALSHDDAWDSADDNDFISLDAVIDSIGNPDGLSKHLANPQP